MKQKNSNAYRVIGLTGGIGSGKSLAAKLITQMGYQTLDADQVSRNLSQPGGLAAPAILARFGTLDRAELKKLIFQDPTAKHDLEQILHPLIEIESNKQLADLSKKSRGGIVFYEASLLVETGRYRDLSALLTIEARDEVRVERIVKRDQCTPEMAKVIISKQTNSNSRRKAATWVIENNDSENDLKVALQTWSEANLK